MSTSTMVSRVNSTFHTKSNFGTALPAKHDVYAVLKPVQEFSKFVFDASNRPIVDALVDKLEDSVESLYLLDLYPIVVTPDRIVVDGQHRLKMARGLMIPFYFLSGEDVSIEDVAKANANTKPYTIEDACAVYTKMEMAPYVALSDFQRRHPKFTIATCASWLSSSYGRHTFTAGKYEISRISFAEKTAKSVEDIAQHNARIFGSKAYRNAIETLVSTPFYDHKRMLERIANRPRMLVNCGKSDEALSVLEQIYNYNKAEYNRVSFQSLLKNSPRPKDDTVIGNNSPDPARGMVSQKTTTVWQTCDYGIFSHHPCARDVRDLSALVAAMREKNLLPYYPIIVDDQYQIIDGQRRYAAAVELGLPLYYIKTGSMSLWMSVIASGISKAWGLQDYVAHFAERGYTEYVWINSFISQHPPFSISTILRALGGGEELKIAMTKAGTMRFDRDFLLLLAGIMANIKNVHLRNHKSLIVVVSQFLEQGQKLERLERLCKALDQIDSNDIVGMTHSYITDVLVEAYNKGLTKGRIEVGTNFIS